MSLIRNGAQIDTKDQDGLTPLHRACGADRNEGMGLKFFDIKIKIGISKISNLEYLSHLP